MATHSSILGWKKFHDRGAGWVIVHGSQRVGHTWACVHTHIWFTVSHYFQLYRRMIQHFHILLHEKLLKDNGYNSLWCIIYPWYLSILYIVVCIYQSHTLNFPLFLSLSPLITTDLFSMSVSLFLFCYIYSFILLLGSTYKKFYHYLSLTYFMKHNNL